MKNFLKKHYKLVVYNMLICMLITMISVVDKRVYAMIDGVEKVYRTNAVDVNYFVKQIAEEHDFEEYKSSTNIEGDTLTSNSIIEIRSLKDIQVAYDGKITNVKTYANNFEELMNELSLDYSIDNDYYFIADQSVLLKDVNEIVITHAKKTNILEHRNIDLEPVHVENPELTKGVVKQGTAGIPTVYEDEFYIIEHDGILIEKTLVNSKIIQQGVAGTIEIGTSSPKTYSGNSVWDDLAACESGGRWNLNTGNGYYGGLQFSAPTWRTAANAVGVSAAYAYQATREEQIMAAEWLLNNTRSGYGQWPACSAKLGLI